MSEITEEVVERISEATPEIVEVFKGVKTSFAVIAATFSAFGGAAIGFEVSRRYFSKKYLKFADDEITVMREHFRIKAQALEAESAKGDIAEIVKARGYAPVISEEPPLAVQPPSSIVAEDTSEREEPMAERLVPPKPQLRNIFTEAKIDDVWDWHTERGRRSPDIPYVIHYEERNEFDEYQKVMLTYYGEDDVLCTGHDEIIDPQDRDRLIGEKNLEKFGHGSNDAAIVYVRNDALTIVYEIVKSQNSFAEEVHGFKHIDSFHKRSGRRRGQERDEYGG